jgi:hypothetical protein
VLIVAHLIDARDVFSAPGRAELSAKKTKSRSLSNLGICEISRAATGHGTENAADPFPGALIGKQMAAAVKYWR